MSYESIEKLLISIVGTLIGFLFVSLYQKSNFSFWQNSFLSGFSIYEILDKIKLSCEENEFYSKDFTTPTDIQFLKFKEFLKFSTLSMLRVGALDKECFSIGTIDILNTERKISFQAYEANMIFFIVNRNIKYPFNKYDLIAIKSALQVFSTYKQNVTPYLLYVFQTRCLILLGLPLFEWYLISYLEAVYHSMISLYSLTSTSTPNSQAFEFLSDMIKSVGIEIDESLEIMVYKEEKKLFELSSLIQLFKNKGV